MSLQYDPTYLYNGGSGNVLANTVLNNYPNSPSSVVVNLDLSNVLAGFLQIWAIPGSVSATNGILVQDFSTSDGVNYDTFSFDPTFTMPLIASTVARKTTVLTTGKYQVKLTNLDPTNNVNVMMTSGIMI